MESIQNKENRIPVKQKPLQRPNAMAVKQKKPIAFGVRDENVHSQQRQLNSKQPLGLNKEKKKTNVFKERKTISQHRLEVCGNKPSSQTFMDVCAPKSILQNTQDDSKTKPLVNPIVPCNQFKAFKVYEDESHAERMARIDEKLKSKVKMSNTGIQVYKGTEEDRFYSKTEIAELERKKREEEEIKKTNEWIHEDQENCDPDEIVELVEAADTPIISNLNLEDNLTPCEFLTEEKKLTTVIFDMEEYRSDIYLYLREHELRHRAKPGYMKKQPDVTPNMRTILVDWLVEVAEEYKLHTETLYLAVNYIDRFLSYMSVVRAKLQLVGTAAMFLASKYEEIYPPDVTEFVYITDDTYTKRQVSRMEHLILKVLGFDLSVITPLSFITTMCIMNDVDEKTKYLAMYLCELGLLNGEAYLEFLPSVLAASAIALARHTLGEEPWSETLAKSIGYQLRDITNGIEFLSHMFEEAPTSPQHAIQDKYKSKKCMHVSTIRYTERSIDYTITYGA